MNIFFFTRFEPTSKNDLVNIVLSSSQKIVIGVVEVRNTFRSVNTTKAVGPGGCAPSLIKSFACQLATVWQPIFQASIDLHMVLTIWKTSIIKPIPKTLCPKQCKDYRPIALTSVIGKCLERILLKYLSNNVKVNNTIQSVSVCT